MTTISTTSGETPTSPPGLIDEIKRQLAQVERSLQEAESSGKGDFSSRMSRKSLQGLEAQMREELCAAELVASSDTAELCLDGDPVVNNQVHARFLGDFLREFQDLVYSVAQVLMGEPTSRGGIARNIIAENRLVVTGFVRGSFGVRVRLPTKEELGQMIEPDSRNVLAKVCYMLGRQTAPPDLTALVAHSRVKKHYKRLVEVIAGQNANVRIRYRENPRGVHVTSREARERSDWLDLIQTHEETITMRGILVGGNIERKRFELQAEDDTYAGRASDDAVRQMRKLHWGDRVEASVRIITTEHEEGAFESSESYRAETFRRLEEST
jgi:hypothetical protein